MNFSFCMNSFFFSVMLFIVGIFILIIQRNHFLLSLLSLEIMVLGLFFLLISVLILLLESYMFLIFLGFVSCEAALGLSLLVSLVRSHGSDFISMISLMF